MTVWVLKEGYIGRKRDEQKRREGYKGREGEKSVTGGEGRGIGDGDKV